LLFIRPKSPENLIAGKVFVKGKSSFFAKKGASIFRAGRVATSRVGESWGLSPIQIAYMEPRTGPARIMAKRPIFWLMNALWKYGNPANKYTNRRPGR